MSQKKWRLLLVLCGLGLALGAADAPSAKPLGVNAVLASVNGEGISLEEILPMTRALENQACAAYSGKQLEKEVVAIRRKALDAVIDRRLMVADYHEQEFTLSSRDVESEIDDIAESMGYRSRAEFIRKLRENGSSIEEVRKTVEERIICQLMIYRMCRIDNFVTPKDVHDYYAAHAAEFATAERIELNMMRLDPKDPKAEENAREVAAVLKAHPERFGELVRRFSNGPAKEDDGALGSVEVKRLRPDFAAAIGGKPVAGRVYGPLTAAEGTIWLRVSAYYPPVEADFAALSPVIRQKLEAEQREKSVKKYTDSLRSKAIIRYYID